MSDSRTEKGNGRVSIQKLYYRMGETVQIVKGIDDNLNAHIKGTNERDKDYRKRIKSLETSRSVAKGATGFLSLGFVVAILEYFQVFKQ
jgi:ribosomal protein L14E/L6E/L27E